MWIDACAARRLGISVVSGFHTNFQQYSNQYGLGLLTRLLTHYLRWFHNKAERVFASTGSLKKELEAHGFKNVVVFTLVLPIKMGLNKTISPAVRGQWVQAVTTPRHGPPVGH